MLHFLIGPSGAFSNFCEEIILAAMRQDTERVEVIRAGTASDLAIGLLGRRAQSALVVLNQAPAALYSAIRDSGRKFVVVCDDPICCLFEMVQAKSNGDLAGAVRAIASCMANLPCYLSIPNALVLHPPLKESTYVEIANHLGLASLRRIGPASLHGLSVDANRWWKSLSGEAHTMTTGALGPMLNLSTELVFDWASILFWQGGDPANAIKGPIDITGRARCLFEGPAIVLPLGAWRLSVDIHFSEMAVGNSFQVEISAGTILETRALVPRNAGKVSTDFDFIIEGANGPVMIRFLLLRAAFDGSVTFAGARVFPR